MLRSVELKRERQELVDQLEALDAKANVEGRELLASEQRTWDRLATHTRELDREVLAAEEFEAGERASAVLIPGMGGTGLETRDAEILGPRDSVRDWAERHGLVKADEPSFGRWIQAALGVAGVGVAALKESFGPEGGFLTPVGVSAEILDLARANSVLIQAGAQVRPIEVNDQTYPRLSQDPTASWLAEGATIPEATMAFEAIVQHPHKIASLVKMTEEVALDAVGLEAFVRDVLAQVFALELDKAGLRGDGVGKPHGIRDWSGISIVSMGTNGAVPTNYDPVMDAIAAVRAANLEPGAWIGQPRDFKTFGKLKDTTLQPLRAPEDVAALRKLSTTSLPINLTQGTSSDTSEAYIGDFSNYVYSVRVGFEVQVLRERYADEGKIGMIARLRADGSPVRDAAFAVITGIRP